MAGTESQHTMYLNIMPGLMTGISTLTAGLASINTQFQAITRTTTQEFNLMTSLIGTAGVVLTQFTKGAMEAYGEFEQGMKIVQAVSNQTIQGIEELTQKANEFSVQYRMDIDQITEGLQTLGRAGLNTATEQAEVLEAGLQTAKLEGRELNSVLQELIQNTALLGGNLKSDDFGEQSEYVNDLLVATSMTAPINTHDISETLKYSGGIAAAAGANIESDEGKQILTDYMGAIAAFAQKGVTGSIAGTALRAFFNKPATQDSSVVDALASIGLKPEYLWQDGGEKMKPVSQQIALIKGQMEELNLSTMDQLQIWSKIVGGKMGQQMMKLEADDIKSLTNDIKSANSASKLANQSMQTYQASLKEAGEAGQVIYRNIGEKFATVAAPILQGITEVLKLLDNPIITAALSGTIGMVLLRAAQAIWPIIKAVGHEMKYMYEQVKAKATAEDQEISKLEEQLLQLKEQEGANIKIANLRKQILQTEMAIANAKSMQTAEDGSRSLVMTERQMASAAIGGTNQAAMLNLQKILNEQMMVESTRRFMFEKAQYAELTQLGIFTNEEVKALNSIIMGDIEGMKITASTTAKELEAMIAEVTAQEKASKTKTGQETAKASGHANEFNAKMNSMADQLEANSGAVSEDTAVIEGSVDPILANARAHEESGTAARTSTEAHNEEANATKLVTDNIAVNVNVINAETDAYLNSINAKTEETRATQALATMSLMFADAQETAANALKMLAQQEFETIEALNIPLETLNVSLEVLETNLIALSDIFTGMMFTTTAGQPFKRGVGRMLTDAELMAAGNAMATSGTINMKMGADGVYRTITNQLELESALTKEWLRQQEYIIIDTIMAEGEMEAINAKLKAENAAAAEWLRQQEWLLIDALMIKGEMELEQRLKQEAIIAQQTAIPLTIAATRTELELQLMNIQTKAALVGLQQEEMLLYTMLLESYRLKYGMETALVEYEGGLVPVGEQSLVLAIETNRLRERLNMALNAEIYAAEMTAGTSAGGVPTSVLRGGRFGAVGAAASSALGALGGPLGVALIGFTVAIEIWMHHTQEIQKKITEANEQMEDALSEFNTANDNLKQLFKEANPEATSEELNDLMLEEYGEMNDKLSTRFIGDMKEYQYAKDGSAWHETATKKPATLPQYVYDEETDDGSMKLLEEEISAEEETKTKLDENTETLYAATAALNMATNKYVNQSLEWWGGVDGFDEWWDTYITQRIGRGGALGDIWRDFNKASGHPLNQEFDNFNSEFYGARELLLTDVQKKDSYMGSTEFTGLLLEDFKDANGNWIKGLRIAMGDSVNDFVNISNEHTQGFMKSMAQFSSNIGASNNMKLQLSMKNDKQTWQQLAKEIAKQEAKSQRSLMSGQSDNKRLENLISKLQATTGGGFSRTQILQAAYMQQMADMYQVAQEQIVPVITENALTNAQNMYINDMTGQNVLGTGESTYSTYAVASTIAAMVSQIAMAQSGEAVRNVALTLDPSSSAENKALHDLAINSEDGADFLKKAAQKGYGYSNIGEALWAGDFDAITSDPGGVLLNLGLGDKGGRFGQDMTAIRAIAINYGTTAKEIGYGYDYDSANAVITKYVDDAIANGASIQSIFDTLAKNYTMNEGFINQIAATYNASNIGENTGDSGGSGAGSGSGSDKDKDKGTTKNRVDLVLCNKKEIPKLNVNLFKKEPSFTVLNKNLRIRDIKVETKDKPKAMLASVKNAIIEVEKRTDPKIIQDEAGEYDPVAATEGNSTPTGNTSTQIDS